MRENIDRALQSTASASQVDPAQVDPLAAVQTRLETLDQRSRRADALGVPAKKLKSAVGPLNEAIQRTRASRKNARGGGEADENNSQGINVTLSKAHDVHTRTQRVFGIVGELAYLPYKPELGLTHELSAATALLIGAHSLRAIVVQSMSDLSIARESRVKALGTIKPALVALDELEKACPAPSAPRSSTSHQHRVPGPIPLEPPLGGLRENELVDRYGWLGYAVNVLQLPAKVVHPEAADDGWHPDLRRSLWWPLLGKTMFVRTYDDAVRLRSAIVERLVHHPGGGFKTCPAIVCADGNRIDQLGVSHFPCAHHREISNAAEASSVKNPLWFGEPPPAEDEDRALLKQAEQDIDDYTKTLEKSEHFNRDYYQIAKKAYLTAKSNLANVEKAADNELRKLNQILDDDGVVEGASDEGSCHDDQSSICASSVVATSRTISSAAPPTPSTVQAEPW